MENPLFLFQARPSVISQQTFPRAAALPMGPACCLLPPDATNGSNCCCHAPVRLWPLGLCPHCLERGSFCLTGTKPSGGWLDRGGRARGPDPPSPTALRSSVSIALPAARAIQRRQRPRRPNPDQRARGAGPAGRRCRGPGPWGGGLATAGADLASHHAARPKSASLLFLF